MAELAREIEAAKLDPRLTPSLRQAGLALRDEMVLELSKPGTGRVYQKSGERRIGFIAGSGEDAEEVSFVADRGNRGGVFHQASAPGEPPAADTGELRASIEVQVEPGLARVGTSLLKGRALERGFVTKQGGVVAPRPWMFPALLNAIRERPEVFAVPASQAVVIGIRRVSS
ncbi:MAG: hypothetical protein KC544_07510 [Gemmatimonadetes bacterium]|nr:hypothetical protein [Gemmatimonadota bacterium]